jgi:hypothetical protein
MLRMTGAVLLVCATSVLVGCGEKGDTSSGGTPSLSGTTSVAQPLPAASRLPKLSKHPNLPDCHATWKAGRTLPQHYDGCLDMAAEMPAPAMGHECADGSRLVVLRGRQWAVTGGPISVVQGGKLLEDKAYLSALESCQPS